MVQGWIDHSSREPFGFPLLDMLQAMLQATMVNVQGPKTPVSMKDFLIGERLTNIELEAVDEEGNPTEDALLLKLEKMFPPGPPPVVLGPDGQPAKPGK
jgi:hypothetical protein